MYSHQRIAVFPHNPRPIPLHRLFSKIGHNPTHAVLKWMEIGEYYIVAKISDVYLMHIQGNCLFVKQVNSRPKKAVNYHLKNETIAHNCMRGQRIK